MGDAGVTVPMPRKAPFSITRIARRLMAPDVLFSLGVGGGLAVLLGRGTRTGLVCGALLARIAYGLLGIEQVVPFTARRHVVLLPVAAELALGAVMFEQFRVQQRLSGKLVSDSDKDHKLIRSLADRVIAAVDLGKGGGFQKHVPRFHWEVIVVREDTANAFVMPGGKIVVYTGLIDLMKRDKDLLAMVMGHEVAHALARHSNERIGFGLYCMLIVQVIVTLLTADQRGRKRTRVVRRKKKVPPKKGWLGLAPEEQDNAEEEAEGDEYEEVEEEVEEESSFWRAVHDMAGGSRAEAAPSGMPMPDTHIPRWLGPRMLSILTNVFLQLPFSRRAEAEADLIGIKLMHLAGFNTDKGPATFELLDRAKVGGGGSEPAGTGFLSALAAAADQAQAQDAMGLPGNAGRAAGLVSAAVNLGCTHPRGQTRVRLLQQELAAGRGRRDGWDLVHIPTDYWAL